MSVSGCDGNETRAPLTGPRSCGAAVQALRTERGFDQPETWPAFVTARTRHQYVPFGTAVVIVARVFVVSRRVLRRPGMLELKPRSAAIWNS